MTPNDQAVADATLPNMAKLRYNSVRFQRYYTAGNTCTAARGTMLTGLYPLQTWMMLTAGNDDAPALDGRSPTFAWMLRLLNSAYGSNFYWFGKWHLGGATAPTNMSSFGFQAGTYPGTFPSPNGWPNEGADGGLWPWSGCGSGTCVGSITNRYGSDADIVRDFHDTVVSRQQNGLWGNPFCAVISLVNPHDISFYPNFVRNYPSSGSCPPVTSIPNFPSVLASSGFPAGFSAPYQAPTVAPNYSDNALCVNKPLLQAVYRQKIAQANNTVTDWTDLLNCYFFEQWLVDGLLGDVLNPSTYSSGAPKVFDAMNTLGLFNNTVIIFVSDHGEYAGAHGLTGKGAAAYEESINVPLWISFPGQRTLAKTSADPTDDRYQLCSSVDFPALIVDLAQLPRF